MTFLWACQNVLPHGCKTTLRIEIKARRGPYAPLKTKGLMEGPVLGLYLMMLPRHVLAADCLTPTMRRGAVKEISILLR